MLASIVTESIDAAAAARNAVTSQGTPGIVGSQSNTAAPKIALKMGSNKALPGGTVQVRVAGRVRVPNDPAKNHTRPDCPSSQSSPVSSRFGFLSAGIESIHCHHLALHSPYVFPNGLEVIGKTPGFGFPPGWANDSVADTMSPKTTTMMATILCQGSPCVGFMMVPPLWSCLRRSAL